MKTTAPEVPRTTPFDALVTRAGRPNDDSALAALVISSVDRLNRGTYLPLGESLEQRLDLAGVPREPTPRMLDFVRLTTTRFLTSAANRPNARPDDSLNVPAAVKHFPEFIRTIMEYTGSRDLVVSDPIGEAVFRGFCEARDTCGRIARGREHFELKSTLLAEQYPGLFGSTIEGALGRNTVAEHLRAAQIGGLFAAGSTDYIAKLIVVDPNRYTYQALGRQIREVSWESGMGPVLASVTDIVAELVRSDSPLGSKRNPDGSMEVARAIHNLVEATLEVSGPHGTPRWLAGVRAVEAGFVKALRGAADDERLRPTIVSRLAALADRSHIPLAPLIASAAHAAFSDRADSSLHGFAELGAALDRVVGSELFVSNRRLETSDSPFVFRQQFMYQGCALGLDTLNRVMAPPVAMPAVLRYEYPTAEALRRSIEGSIGSAARMLREIDHIVKSRDDQRRDGEGARRHLRSTSAA